MMEWRATEINSRPKGEEMNNDQRDSNDEKDTEQPPLQGVFITENMQVSIPPGGLNLQIGENGELKPPTLTLHLLIDMSVYWLKIAWSHLQTAELGNINLKAAVAARNEEQIKNALETEFSASIQVFASVAFSLETFDKMVRARIVIPENLIASWEENETSWAKQLTEVLKLGFEIKGTHVKNLALLLKTVATYRNEVVHGSANAAPPVYHPELGMSTELHFVRYKYLEAKLALDAILGLYVQLLPRNKTQYKSLTLYCQAVERAMQPLMTAWEQNYGLLSYRKEQQKPS